MWPSKRNEVRINFLNWKSFLDFQDTLPEGGMVEDQMGVFLLAGKEKQSGIVARRNGKWQALQ